MIIYAERKPYVIYTAKMRVCINSGGLNVYGMCLYEFCEHNVYANGIKCCTILTIMQENLKWTSYAKSMLPFFFTISYNLKRLIPTSAILSKSFYSCIDFFAKISDIDSSDICSLWMIRRSYIQYQYLVSCYGGWRNCILPSISWMLPQKWYQSVQYTSIT